MKKKELIEDALVQITILNRDKERSRKVLSTLYDEARDAGRTQTFEDINKALKKQVKRK